MKANELMIDDWVYNKNIDKPIQIYPMIFSQMFRSNPNATTEDYNIFPIPLTTEILEKNGWKSLKNGSGDFILTKPMVGNSATITKTINGYEMSYGVFNGLVIHYIHQLQHALRLCRVNKEIEL